VKVSFYILRHSHGVPYATGDYVDRIYMLEIELVTLLVGILNFVKTADEYIS